MLNSGVESSTRNRFPWAKKPGLQKLLRVLPEQPMRLSTEVHRREYTTRWLKIMLQRSARLWSERDRELGRVGGDIAALASRVKNFRRRLD